MNALLDLGPHAGFIWAAYGATAVILAGLIIWIRADARHQLRLLEELEAQGVRRRSAGTPSASKKRGKGKSQRS